MTVADELAGWGAGLTLGAIPPPVRRAAARHLLDGIGVGLAAARTGTAEAAVAVAAGLGGPAEAVVLGGTTPVGTAAAAFGTGVLVHALDFDDTHAEGLVHATAAVLPTALSVGQQVGATGADVLSAAVVGYEVVCRVAAGSPHGFHARGLHATGVCAPLAAAAVASRLLRLDAATTVAALGIAGSSAAGLLEFLTTGSSTKQLHPGSAALAGVVAARLAKAGASGPATVVEGTRGLYAALSGRPADPGRVVRDLAGTSGATGQESWETVRLTVKGYPCCQLMHGALDAVTDLLAAGLDPDEITDVCVALHPDGAAVVSGGGDVKATPRTPYEAKFSLPWTVAALLLDGRVTVDTYAADSLRRPAVAALARRVRTVDTAESGPAAAAVTRVVVGLADGRSVAVEVAGSRGSPEQPLDDDALRAKFTANAGGPGAAADELADRVSALAEQESLSTLCRLAATLASGGSR